MSGNEFTDFLSQSEDIFSFDVSASQTDTPLTTLFENINSFDISGKIRATALLETVAVTTATSGTITKNYRMRGYDPVLSAYEFWITTDPTSTVPPSLNVLTSVVVESVLE